MERHPERSGGQAEDGRYFAHAGAVQTTVVHAGTEQVHEWWWNRRLRNPPLEQLQALLHVVVQLLLQQLLWWKSRESRPPPQQPWLLPEQQVGAAGAEQVVVQPVQAGATVTVQLGVEQPWHELRKQKSTD